MTSKISFILSDGSVMPISIRQLNREIDLEHFRLGDHLWGFQPFIESDKAKRIFCEHILIWPFRDNRSLTEVRLEVPPCADQHWSGGSAELACAIAMARSQSEQPTSSWPDVIATGVMQRATASSANPDDLLVKAVEGGDSFMGKLQGVLARTPSPEFFVYPAAQQLNARHQQLLRDIRENGTTVLPVDSMRELYERGLCPPPPGTKTTNSEVGCNAASIAPDHAPIERRQASGYRGKIAIALCAIAMIALLPLALSLYQQGQSTDALDTPLLAAPIKAKDISNNTDIRAPRRPVGDVISSVDSSNDPSINIIPTGVTSSGPAVSTTTEKTESTGKLTLPAPSSTNSTSISDDLIPKLIRIPDNYFFMGCEGGDKCLDDSHQIKRADLPRHDVYISSFRMGVTEVTHAQFQHFLTTTGYKHIDGNDRPGDHPATYVSWNDAQAYLSWLNKTTGQCYRLPTESEWESATRASTTTRYNTGDTLSSEQANIWAANTGNSTLSSQSLSQTSPVGQYSPNAWGLFDTHGGVWEWVQDSWRDNYHNAPKDGSAYQDDSEHRRVLRGGSFSVAADFALSSMRIGNHASARFNSVGFRVAADLHCQ